MNCAPQRELMHPIALAVPTVYFSYSVWLISFQRHSLRSPKYSVLWEAHVQELVERQVQNVHVVVGDRISR